MALGRQIATSLALAATALAIAACGKDSPQGDKIPAADAQALTTKLGEVADRAEQGKCDGENSASSSLGAIQDAVDGLPSGTSQDIRDGLNELIGKVAEQIDANCQEGGVTTSADTTASSTTSSDLTKPDKTTSSTTSTTDSTSTSTTTSTTTTTPPEPPNGNGPTGSGPPAGSNGNGNGNGGVEPDPGTGGTSPGNGRSASDRERMGG